MKQLRRKKLSVPVNKFKEPVSSLKPKVTRSELSVLIVSKIRCQFCLEYNLTHAKMEKGFVRYEAGGNTA